jgi:hypothetical protein
LELKRDVDSDRLGGLKIDPQFDLCRLFHRQVVFDFHRTNLRIPPDLSPVSIRLALLFLLLTRGARKDRPSPGPEMLLASTTLANIASEFGSVIFYPTYGNVILGFST